MMQKIYFIIATFFGSGLAKKAPGTFGSLATLPFAFLMAYFFGFNGIFYATVITFLIGAFAVKKVTQNLNERDPGKIVIDETAGQLTSFLLVANYLQNNLSWTAFLVYALGFGLFRLFDIAKFGPVEWADTKLENEWGVMLDDIFAGLFATIVLMFFVSGL